MSGLDLFVKRVRHRRAFRRELFRGFLKFGKIGLCLIVSGDRVGIRCLFDLQRGNFRFLGGDRLRVRGDERVVIGNAGIGPQRGLRLFQIALGAVCQPGDDSADHFPVKGQSDGFFAVGLTLHRFDHAHDEREDVQFGVALALARFGDQLVGAVLDDLVQGVLVSAARSKGIDEQLAHFLSRGGLLLRGPEHRGYGLSDEIVEDGGKVKPFVDEFGQIEVRKIHVKGVFATDVVHGAELLVARGADLVKFKFYVIVLVPVPI